MLGRSLLELATHDAVRRVVTSAPISRNVARRFVAGETTAEAVAAVAEIAGSGRLVTVDHLGEDTLDLRSATAATDAYLRLLDALSGAGLIAVAEVSVKLTVVGLALPNGVDIALSNAQRIVKKSAELGTTVTIDMEDHTKTSATLEIVSALRKTQPDVGVAVQAYLRRTEADLVNLCVPGSRIRLCKGAYREAGDVAFVDRGEISAAYSRCLHILMSGPGYPMVATHDPQLIELTSSLAVRHLRKPGSFEYQLLNGVRPDEQLRLAAAGGLVRVYLPYGQEWYGYMMRRMAEKPANLALFIRAMTSRR
jgi:proline dehydrogenase